jgi:L-fuconolactonase
VPDFPIIDTHLHLWDLQRLSYPWLAGAPKLNRSFLIDDFRAACGPVKVAKMVFVQCDCVPEQAVAEAEWVSSVAHEDGRLRGIVARASLENGEAAHEQVAKLAEMPLVKGVRRLIQGEADPEFCLRPKFVRGVQMLHAFGLSFDLCIKHPQLTATIKLVRQCPDVQFVLDHVGKPDIRAARLDPWRDEIRELAQMSNVTCKISGLATEADAATWTTAQLKPYIEHVIECFGFDRVMFGGDWPVSTLATSYPRWVATLDEVLRGCSASEHRRFWVENAEMIYRV